MCLCSLLCIHCKLCIGNFLSLFQKTVCCLCSDRNIQIIICTLLQRLRQCIWDHDILFLLRFQFFCNLPLSDHGIVFLQFPYHIIFGQILGNALVFDMNGLPGQLIFLRGKPEILILISNFLKLRLWISVCRNKTVLTEILVSGFISPITSISEKISTQIIKSACMRILCSVIIPGTILNRNLSRLIHPVPDKAAKHVIILPDNIPIFLQISYRISHGMIIFAENKRHAAFILCIG